MKVSKTNIEKPGITGRRTTAMVVSFLLLVATALLSPVPSHADVGDQYLPEVPSAGGKEDKSQTEIPPVPAPEYGTTVDEKGAEKEKPSDESTEKAQISPLPPDQGGGPGTGAVVALIVLGAALVGSLFWMVSRGQRIDAESGSPDGDPHRPDTPHGEITGDGSTDNR